MGKIVKMKNKRTGEKVYPVTATSAVVDANTGERLNDALKNKVEEAPIDGEQYARVNGKWEKIEAGPNSGGTSGVETVIINLLPDNLDLIGTKIQVKNWAEDVEEETKEYTWNGTPINIEIKAGYHYSITPGEAEGYVSPSGNHFRATSGYVREVSYLYKVAIEVLTVNVSGLSNGFTISVKDNEGKVLGTQNTSSKTYNVKSDTEYYVYASEVGGYNVLSYSGPYIAVAENTRTVNVVYSALPYTDNPGNGVWIKDTAGNYWSVDNWDKTATPDCIAVISDSCRFGIALKDLGTMMISDVGTTEYDTVLKEYTEASGAYTDFDGKSNTTKMLSIFNHKDFAAFECNGFVFPSGKTGYLGSMGEWNVAYANREAVFAALSSAGGDSMSNTPGWWSSTFYGISGDKNTRWFWGCLMNENDPDSNYVMDFCYSTHRAVRPFCDL